MFVINRKRIQIMLSAILVSVLVFGVQISLKEKEELTVETTSTPISNKTIVIDAGHGTPDEGGSLLHQVKNRSNYFFIKNNCRCKSLQFF